MNLHRNRPTEATIPVSTLLATTAPFSFDAETARLAAADARRRAFQTGAVR